MTTSFATPNPHTANNDAPFKQKRDTVISAVVLAAAAAKLSNEPKFFLPLRGKPVLQWVLERALAADLDEVICVTRDLKSVRRQLTVTDKRLFWLAHYDADPDQRSSMIAGLWAINPKSEGVMFLPGDQPLIRTGLINALIERFTGGSAYIVAPRFNGQPRHPILFRRELFPELIQLNYEHGTGALLEKYSRRTALVESHDEISFLHLEANEDLERIKELV